jgi:hypothetical protein
MLSDGVIKLFTMRIQIAHLDHPLVPLLLTAIAYALFIGLFLRSHQNDPSYFVAAGDAFANPAEVSPNLHVLAGSNGYDGQFYYRLALDPFTSKQTDFGVTLDSPAYRNDRIVYPLLTWIVSLGRAEAVPAVMILLNYLALCAIGGMAGMYARTLGRHALWGLSVVFYPGFLFSLARDLTEILAICFLLASLLLIARKHFVIAAVALAIAILTRETTLVWVVGGIIAWGAAKLVRKQADVPWYVLVTPIVVFALWEVVLTLHWGMFPLAGNGKVMFGLPFGGLLPQLIHDLRVRRGIELVWLAELLLFFLSAAAVLYVMRSSMTQLQNKVAWLLYAGEALLGSDVFWREDWAYMRLLSEFYLLGAIILLATPSRIKYVVFAAAFALWLYLFRDFITLR